MIKPPEYNPYYIDDNYDIKPSAPPVPQKRRKNNIFCIIDGKVMSGKTTYIKNQLIKNNYDVIVVCYLNYMIDEYNDFTSIITNQLIMRDWFNKKLKCCLILEDCYIRVYTNDILNILIFYKEIGVDIYIATQQREDIPLIIQKLSNKKLYMTRNW